MAQVYSVRLAAVFASLGPDTFVVPAGFRWVIRDICMFLRLDMASVYQAKLTGSDGQVIAAALSSEVVDVAYHWDGRQVLEAGESFQLTATQPTDFTVSGYALSLP
jgi:hypothetical protein